MANANIFGLVGQGVRSPLDYAGDFQRLQAGQDQAKANKLALLLQERKMEADDRALQSQNKLRSVAAGFGQDDDANVQSLYQGGFLTEAQDYAKNVAGRAKDKAAADKDLADTQAKQYALQRQKFEHRVQGLSQFQDAQGAKQWLAESVMNGALSMEEAQQMVAKVPTDPAAFMQWRDASVMSLLDAGKQAGYIKPDANATLSAQTSQANNAANNARIAQEGAANRAVQMRGQNLTDARSRESNSAAVSKPFEVTGPDGLPILVRQDKAGNITPVEGYGPKTGASKPLNDTQAKALLFGTRMQEANKALESLNYSPAAINAKAGAENIPIIGGLAGVAGNAMLSAENQQAEQAQRDFINAVLRRESGAAIAESEFNNARRQYFPQPNDKPATLAQKARNRQLAIDGLLAEVPEGRRTSITPKDQPAGNLSAAEAAELEQLRKMFPGRK